MGKIAVVLVAVVGIVGLVFLLAALFAWPTLLLCNYMFTKTVLLTLFGIPQLTFWKAFWLNFLVGILFKSSTTVNNK